VKAGWESSFSNLEHQQTTVFIDDFTKDLHVMLTNALYEYQYRTVRVTGLRPQEGQVLVETEVEINSENEPEAVAQIECVIVEELPRWRQGKLASLNASMPVTSVERCREKETFCQNGGTLARKESGSFYCICLSSYKGEQCEESWANRKTTLIVVIIATTVPMLFIFILCCMLNGRDKKKKRGSQGNLRANLMDNSGTTKSFQYLEAEGSDANLKSSPRMYADRGMNENADTEGYTPRRI
jgi:hypothetical protein